MKKIFTLVFSIFFFMANSQTTIISEDFSGGMIPSSWAISNFTSNTCGGFQYQASQTWPTSTITGPHMSAAVPPSAGGPCQSGTYILIPFNGIAGGGTSGFTSIDIELDHYFYNFMNNDTAEIFYSINSGTSWTLLQDFTGITTSGTLNYNITNLSSNMMLAIQHKGNSGFGWDIDNLLITGNGGSVTCTHTFNMYDSYGDGWNGAYVMVTVNGATVVPFATITSAQGSANSETFSAASGDAIDLFNWVSGSYNSEISWDITDGNGTVIAGGGTMAGGGGFGLPGTCAGNCGPAPSWDCISPGNCQNPGTGNGQYPTLLDCQNACAASWDCVNGACIDPGNGSGGYNDSLLCVTNCIAASWDCVNGVCTDPGNGSGTYNDSIVCVASCFPASWDCNNITGVCFDPGTGNGQHPTLLDCQNVCVATPSWNCISPGNCQDPGNGSGTFLSLVACQSSCVPTISMDNDVPVNFLIFTDRTGLEIPNGNASGVSVSITPHSSNPRNYLNPGRTVRFKVGVTNNLSTNLTSADITLIPSMSDPFVTVTINQVGLNNITSTATEFTLNEFEIVIDNSCPPGHIFYADFEIHEQITQTTYYSTAYPIIIEPFVNTSTTFIDDDSNPDSNGNNDNIVNPNETIEITPMLVEVLPNTIDATDLNGSSSGSPGSTGFAFPGSEDELVGCLLNINNYNFINIWDNVAGATGANVVDCLPDPGIFNSEWYVQAVQSVDYIRPGFDYVFDFNASSTCKFNLYVEFEAAMTWNVVTSPIKRWNDRIRWLSKIEINTNEPPCIPTNNLSYTINSNKIFPNPFKERAFLELKDNVTHNILLFDVMGKLLREYKDINNDKLVIERGSLSSGTYLLKILNSSEIRIKKLIIE